MQKMDCFRACRLSNRMAMGGTAGAVIGCGLGSLALVSRALWGVLAVGGFGVLLAGLAIG